MSEPEPVKPLDYHTPEPWWARFKVPAPPARRLIRRAAIGIGTFMLVFSLFDWANGSRDVFPGALGAAIVAFALPKIRDEP